MGCIMNDCIDPIEIGGMHKQIGEYHYHKSCTNANMNENDDKKHVETESKMRSAD